MNMSARRSKKPGSDGAERGPVSFPRALPNKVWERGNQPHRLMPHGFAAHPPLHTLPLVFPGQAANDGRIAAMKITLFPILTFTLISAVAGALAQPADTLSFGSAASEKAHALTAELSEITKGGLEEPARTLLPREPLEWQGGKVAFTMKADPAAANYFTVKLWGSDQTRNRLTLFCEGKQVGYRHLGDIDMLDIGGGEAGCR